MIPEIGRAGIQIGCLLVVPTSVLLFFLEPGTAEWSITVLTLIIGVVFLGIMIGLTLRGRR